MAFDPGPQSETVCLEECQAASPCCTTREKGKKGKSFFPGKPKTQPENGGILYMVRKKLVSVANSSSGFSICETNSKEHLA